MTGTLDEMAALLAEIFERPIALTPEMTAADVIGWDSFKHVEILMELEERYGIELPTTEVSRTRTIGELAALVDAKRRNTTGR